MRVPDVGLAERAGTVETLTDVADRWRRGRIDVSEGTRRTHAVNLGRVLPTLGERAPAEIRKADVADLVASLHEQGLGRESIRKTISTLSQVLDYAEVSVDPTAGVRLPEREHEPIQPPGTAHVEAVLAALGSSYRLAAVVLDQTGMRVSELTSLAWGDVDEREGRWRVQAANAKTRSARWVPVPESVFLAVRELVPREDRDLALPVFAITDAQLRTAIARACKATGTPLFSPHDLRHRRASLWHLAGVPAVEAASWLGHSPVEQSTCAPMPTSCSTAASSTSPTCSRATES